MLRTHDILYFPAQGKDEKGADQVNRDHRQQLGRGGDRGEAGAGGPHRLAHIYTAGMLHQVGGFLGCERYGQR